MVAPCLVAWQVPSCRENLFEAGSPPRTHGKITTSPVDHGTKRSGHGLLTARYSRNGKRLDKVPSFGLMGNVSYHPALTFLRTLIVFPFVAGAGKSVLWCAGFILSVFHLGAYVVEQFCDYRRHRDNAKIWGRVTCYVLLRLPGRFKKGPPRATLIDVIPAL
jgi:hypothetical protein